MDDSALLRDDAFAIKRATVRGLSMAFVHAGAGGIPVLLIHGWPETKRIWYRNIGVLAAAGFEVIAPDLRGFGDTEIAPDGFYDVAAHARDLYALAHDVLGHAHVCTVGGDLGGAVLQDLGRRFPGWVARQIIFNAPLPYLKDEHRGLRTRPPLEAADYYIRQGTDADALLAELATDDQRRAYIATFYGHRFWAAAGAFSPEAVAFMTAPFADAQKLRAGWGNYESALGARPVSEPPLWGKNDVPTLILFGPEDHVIYPDFDRMAAAVFSEHVGPFIVRGTGHFLQWEAAHVLNQTIRYFCGAPFGRERR
jgi:pimeloyl-ACP methyl ester carboxylesterase